MGHKGKGQAFFPGQPGEPRAISLCQAELEGAAPQGAGGLRTVCAGGHSLPQACPRLLPARGQVPGVTVAAQEAANGALGLAESKPWVLEGTHWNRRSSSS